VTRTIVHLLRHGEVFNPRHVLYGRLPGFHLSEAGLLMAKRAAEALTGHDVVLVLSSPLERARETAEPVAARFGVPVEIDERLIEATNAFEGQRVGDGALRRPQPVAAVLGRAVRGGGRPDVGRGPGRAAAGGRP